jgi:DNA repair protein RadC
MYQVSEQPAVTYTEDKRPVVRGPESAAPLFSDNIPEAREAFQVIYLDTRHRALAPAYVVSLGTINASLVHPREVFREAVRLGAAAIICAHNHPSGELSPSGDDLDLTGRLDKAGKILGIQLLDHLILASDGRHVSIRTIGWPCAE